jgi:hypothetical protein
MVNILFAIPEIHLSTSDQQYPRTEHPVDKGQTLPSLSVINLVPVITVSMLAASGTSMLEPGRQDHAQATQRPTQSPTHNSIAHVC